MAWCMVWPDRQGMVYVMAWRARHGIVVWPGGNNMVYSIAWRSWHGICYRLTGMAWYMVWPYWHGIGNGMVYGIAR